MNAISATANIRLLDEMRHFIKDVKKMQRLLDKLMGLQAFHLKEVYRLKDGIAREQLRIYKNSKQLEMLNERIPKLEKMIKKKMPKQYLEEYEYELWRATTSRNKLNEKLALRDETDLIIDELFIGSNQFFADKIDALVEHIGEWFMSGAIGPGELRFREKVFIKE
jgi:hypothetical protein